MRKHIYQATFLIHGFHPGFIGYFLGIPIVQDSSEIVIFQLSSPITSEQDLEEIKKTGQQRFGSTRTHDGVQYDPRVEVVAINYLGEHPVS